MTWAKRDNELGERVKTEVKVRFDAEELDRFFEGFVPLSSPLDDRLDPPAKAPPRSGGLSVRGPSDRAPKSDRPLGPRLQRRGLEIRPPLPVAPFS